MATVAAAALMELLLPAEQCEWVIRNADGVTRVLSLGEWCPRRVWVYDAALESLPSPGPTPAAPSGSAPSAASLPSSCGCLPSSSVPLIAVKVEPKSDQERAGAKAARKLEKKMKKKMKKAARKRFRLSSSIRSRIEEPTDIFTDILAELGP